MKTYVSYVIQDQLRHKHGSEILISQNPSYSYSADPPVNAVLNWAENKKKELNAGEELIVLSMYNI